MLTNRVGLVSLIALAILIPVAATSPASAELYVGGQLGFTIPEDLGGVREVGGGIRLTDLDLNNSFTYGAKVGYFLERAKWLGFETDLYTTTPHLEGQDATRTNAAGVSSNSRVVGALTKVTTLAFSLVGRYPGERFQPYAGLGMGIYFAKATQAFARDTDSAPGFHLLGGARLFVSREVALFGEYKYDRATFRFRDLDTNGPGSGNGLIGDYQAHTLVIGISYHFF